MQEQSRARTRGHSADGGDERLWKRCERAEESSRGADEIRIARAIVDEVVRDVGSGEFDRVDQYAEFDPRVDYRLTVTDSELTDVEREARVGGARRPLSADNIQLDLGAP